MSEEAVEPESAATKTWCPKSLSLAECYCRIVDSDLVADDGGRWKFAIAIQHADGMQEQQNKAKIEKVLRRFYPPSLAWVHFIDTQLLLKCQSESFLIASNVPQSALSHHRIPQEFTTYLLISKRYTRPPLCKLLQS